MRFQSQLGQTKVDFNNQGKNMLQRIAFWLEIFLFKIEIECGNKLKWSVETSLKYCQFLELLLRSNLRYKEKDFLKYFQHVSN